MSEKVLEAKKSERECREIFDLSVDRYKNFRAYTGVQLTRTVVTYLIQIRWLLVDSGGFFAFFMVSVAKQQLMMQKPF